MRGGDKKDEKMVGARREEWKIRRGKGREEIR